MLTQTNSLTNVGSESRLLTARELAARLGVSEAGVRKWLLEGKLPAVRLGKCVRFDLAEVLASFAQRAGGAR